MMFIEIIIAAIYTAMQSFTLLVVIPIADFFGFISDLSILEIISNLNL